MRGMEINSERKSSKLNEKLPKTNWVGICIRFHEEFCLCLHTCIYCEAFQKFAWKKKLNVSNLFESDWFARDWKTIAVDNVLNENYPNHWGVKQKTNENVRIKENLYWQKCTITSAHSEKVSCVVFVHSLLISRTRN